MKKTPFTLERIATFIERVLDYKIRKDQASSFKHLQSNKVPILCQFYGDYPVVIHKRNIFNATKKHANISKIIQKLLNLKIKFLQGIFRQKII